jgi:hypothetical protein
MVRAQMRGAARVAPLVTVGMLVWDAASSAAQPTADEGRSDAQASEQTAEAPSQAKPAQEAAIAPEAAPATVDSPATTSAPPRPPSATAQPSATAASGSGAAFPPSFLEALAPVEDSRAARLLPEAPEPSPVLELHAGLATGPFIVRFDELSTSTAAVTVAPQLGAGVSHGVSDIIVLTAGVQLAFVAISEGSSATSLDLSAAAFLVLPTLGARFHYGRVSSGYFAPQLIVGLGHAWTTDTIDELLVPPGEEPVETATTTGIELGLRTTFGWHLDRHRRWQLELSPGLLLGPVGSLNALITLGRSL